MASAGRILIMPKGTYDESASYEMLDLVFYGTSAWLCRKSCTGIAPDDVNEEYWFKFSSIALANNLTTEGNGYALDAKQGKILKDLIDGNIADIEELSESVTGISAAIDTLLGSNIAEEYSESKTYAVGDYCTYNGQLYKCVVAVTEAKAFDTANWEIAHIMDEIAEKTTEIVDTTVGNRLSELAADLATLYNPAATYNEGDLVIYGTQLYKCTTAITVAESWDVSHWAKTDVNAQIGKLSTLQTSAKTSIVAAINAANASSNEVYYGDTSANAVTVLNNILTSDNIPSEKQKAIRGRSADGYIIGWAHHITSNFIDGMIVLRKSGSVRETYTFERDCVTAGADTVLKKLGSGVTIKDIALSCVLNADKKISGNVTSEVYLDVSDSDSFTFEKIVYETYRYNYATLYLRVYADSTLIYDKSISSNQNSSQSNSTVWDVSNYSTIRLQLYLNGSVSTDGITYKLPSAHFVNVKIG